MFFEMFERTRDSVKLLVHASAWRERGTCTASDGTEMRFRLYGEAAYILPPRDVREGKPKGVWIHRRGLSFLNPTFKGEN